MKNKSKFSNPQFWTAMTERFVRAFISGALAIAVPIELANIKDWNDLKIQVGLLMISLVVGGINGVLMAVDKGLRFK